MLPADLAARLEAAGLPTDADGLLVAMREHVRQKALYDGERPDAFRILAWDGPRDMWTVAVSMRGGHGPTLFDHSAPTLGQAVAEWLLAAKEAHRG